MKCNKDGLLMIRIIISERARSNHHRLDETGSHKWEREKKKYTKIEKDTEKRPKNLYINILKFD